MFPVFLWVLPSGNISRHLLGALFLSLCSSRSFRGGRAKGIKEHSQSWTQAIYLTYPMMLRS